MRHMLSSQTRLPVTFLIVPLCFSVLVSCSRSRLSRRLTDQVSITNEIKLGRAEPYDFEIEPPRVALDLTFSHDGSALFVRRRDGSLERWRLADGAMEVLEQGAKALDISVSGRTLAIVEGSGRAVLKHTADDEQMDLGEMMDVQHVATNDHGNVAISSGDNRIKLLATPLSVETKLPVRNGLAISADGRVIAAATGQYVAEEVAGDGATVGHRGTIEVHNLNTGKQTIHDTSGTILGMWQIHISNNRLATTSQTNARSGLVVWDLASGQQLFSRGGFDSYWVRALAMTRDGRMLLSGDERGWLRLWDIEHDQLLLERRESLPIQSTAISGNQELIAWGSWNALVHVGQLTGVSR